ncbi:MAG: phosphoserine transaminase [Halobacteriovoraceae bacterium]|nr:phosphoserine transaminase [Halobacteriovoraceae bacterium]MCB9093816.1 phosphoserine transaminase [Halobacteriovoraceae bacterium]
MFEKLTIPQELIPSDPRFGCGPSLIPTETLNNLAKTGNTLLGTSHRKSGVKNLVKEIQEGLTQYFELEPDRQVILGNGGATFLWDMIGTGMVNKASFHNVCGEFSSKWHKAHANIPWIEASKKEVDFGEGITPEKIEGHDVICTTLNETSTGVQMTSTPTYNDDTLVAMDATSGAGQIETNLKNIDFYYFSPQKVFASEGGLFVGFISEKARERVLKIENDKNRYKPITMSWKLALENSEKNQTYNTPSISTLFFLNESVKELNRLGRAKVTQLAREKADHLYQWAESKPYLEAYVHDEKFRSTAVATINVDEKIPVEELTKKLRELKVVYDIDAYRKLGKNQFRISLFHYVTKENLEKLTQLLSLAIESHL